MDILTKNHQDEVKKIQSQIDNITLGFELKKKCLEHFVQNFELIQKGFKAIRFEVESFQPEVYLRNDSDYYRHDGLPIWFKLKMVSTRKPFKEDGYRYMTQKDWNRIVQNVSNDQQKFFEITGQKIGINQYSLDKTNGILCDMYYKI
jgi:hypothetical protein